MRERDRWGSYWVREGVRLKKREREGGVKQMCQNCIPTMNMNTLCAEGSKKEGRINHQNLDTTSSRKLTGDLFFLIIKFNFFVDEYLLV